MSRQPNMRAGGVRRGPYGPNNPPPPPVAPPPGDQRMEGRRRPNLEIRRRAYAQAEAEKPCGREQERIRSRSPACPQDRRNEQPRYRERSPLRHEPMNTQPRRDDRRHEPAESMRCFACNEPGHRAADCRIAQNFGRKACFRCGETGHIARACKVRVGQIKTDAEVAADKSNSNFNEYYNNDRGDDEGRSPSQEATGGDHAFGYTHDGYEQPQERLSMVPSCAGYYVEDEVDWDDDDDDDALETSNAAPVVGMSADRKTQQPEHSTYAMENKYEKPHRHYEGPEKHTTAAQNVSVKSTQRNSNWNPDRLKMAREPKLGLPHLQNAKVDDVPPTVHDLRGYDYRIQVMYASKPMNQRFINGGNGKIAPAIYGSEQRHDLGLCFATFLTRKRCEMGVNCPWRHHPLSNAERAWIIEYGKKKGKQFIDNIDRWWAFPEVPVPGATMHGLGDKDT